MKIPVPRLTVGSRLSGSPPLRPMTSLPPYPPLACLCADAGTRTTSATRTAADSVPTDRARLFIGAPALGTPDVDLRLFPIRKQLVAQDLDTADRCDRS